MKHSIKRQLRQILDICVEKQINLIINTEVFNVSISIGGMYLNAYYYGRLYNYVDNVTNCVTLSEFLKQVKKY